VYPVMPERDRFDPTEQLERARAFAAWGWRPFPVEHGGKRPAVGFKWGTRTATPPTETELEQWFGRAPMNIGIAAKGSGLVIIDEDAQGAFLRLAADHGQDVPLTYTVATAKGRHYYFTAPDGYPIGNAPGELARYGIDVRGGQGDGGYVVAAGSLHSSGAVYTVAEEADAVDMPMWLVELLLPQLSPEPPISPGSDAEDSLFGDSTRRFTPAQAREYMTAYATEPLQAARPGHRNATLNNAATVVGHFVPAFLSHQRARARLLELAAGIGLGGAEASATADSGLARGMTEPYVRVEEATSNADPELSSWKPVDLGAIWDGTAKRREATVLRRTGAEGEVTGAFYPGLVHSVHGESETGKSWIAQWATVEALADGGAVLYVDFESQAEEVLPRLRAMGLEREWLKRLVYVSPDGPGDLVFASIIAARDFAVAVIDGVTASLAAYAAKSNGQDEVTEWHQRLPARVAKETGAAVIEVDHVTKSSEGRGRFAVGSQAKMANLSGSAFYVELVQALRPGDVGSIALWVAKDRPGDVRAHSGPMKASRLQPWGKFVLDATSASGAIRVQVLPLEPDAEPTDDVPGFSSDGKDWQTVNAPDDLAYRWIPDERGRKAPGASLATGILKILWRDGDTAGITKPELRKVATEVFGTDQGAGKARKIPDGSWSEAWATLLRSKLIEPAETASRFVMTDDARALFDRANQPLDGGL
jgi:hypothetical protein